MAATTTRTLDYDDLPALLTRLTGDEKHDRSSLSTLDVLWVLYDRVLRDEDRFLLSKATDRPRSTRCSPPRASSPSTRSTASARSTRRSATTRIACSRPESRSRAARSATGWALRSV